MRFDFFSLAHLRAFEAFEGNEMTYTDQTNHLRTKPMLDVEWEAPIIAGILQEMTNWLQVSPKICPEEVCKAMHIEVSGQNTGNGAVMLDARKRLRVRAADLGILPPISVICEDGAPTDALLDFCKTTGTSLDWVFAD
jgi:hypothetical protein